MTTPNEVMLWATNLGELSTVQLCVIKYRADGNPAVGPAMTANQKSIFKWLLEKGGARGTETLMDTAATKLDKDYIKTLYVSGGQDILAKNLLASTTNGLYETTKYILGVKANYVAYNNSEAFIYAVNQMTNSNEYLRIVNQFLKTPGVQAAAQNQRALQRAIQDLGNLSLCKELVKKGADLHYSSNLPLQWAQSSGKTEIVKWISGVYQKEFKRQ